jgi:glycosyltransferase involved in cell wall biosynthesis
MMKLGLVMQGGQGWMGGAQYVLNWARVLAPRSGDRHTVEIVCETSEQLDLAARSVPWCSTRAPSALLRRPARALNPALFRTLGCRPSLELLLAGAGYDFVYPTFPGIGVPTRYRYASWIPDLQHVHLPEFFSAKDRSLLDRHFRRLARHADTLVLSSQAALDDLLTFEPRAAVRVTTLRFHTLPDEKWFEGAPIEVQKRYDLPDRFLLVSNQFWRHKNHETLFRAIARLKEQRVTLVATGALDDLRAPGFVDVVRGWIRDLGIVDRVRLLGLIPRSDQVQLMRRSLAVIQPSLFEGWSTVIEDALALGKPVVASDLAVNREQLGQDATFFSPRDDKALAEILDTVWREFEPGPEREAERLARERTRRAQQMMLTQFFELARRTRNAT